MDREPPLAEIQAEKSNNGDATEGIVSVPSNAAESDHTAAEKDAAKVESDYPDPTPEELATLPRVADHLPIATWLVAIVELCERFTFYGVVALFQNYMQNPPNDPRLPGAIGLGQQGATALSYFFQFFSYVTPILGAVIADQYLGKYKTIFLFAIIYSFGNLVLFCTSLPVAIANGASLGGLITAMIVIGLGTGGIKSNVSPLIAEQYTNTRRFVKQLKNGRKVIIDPAITIQRVFMFFYACINIGGLSAIATTLLEFNVGFWAAFLLPFVVFFVAIVVLVVGRHKYVSRPPRGSVIPDAVRVCMMAMKQRNMEAAKPSWRAQHGDHGISRWSDQFVDEVKRALVACRIFTFYPIYWVVYGQMLSNFVSQAGQMELHGIPNDIMQNINPITVIIFIPIIEMLVYPGLRRIGIRFLPITRIFFGFVFASVAMAYAAFVQHLIYTRPPCFDNPLACVGGTAPNQIHVAVQTPAYMFIALSEIFASITGLEYAFSKAPPSMKSFITSMFLLTNAFGSAMGIAISPTATNRNQSLLWMYTGLSIATLTAGTAFIFIFRKYNRSEDAMNQLDALNLEDQAVPVTAFHKIKRHKEIIGPDPHDLDA